MQAAAGSSATIAGSIRHVVVTSRPTAAWTAHQFVEAFHGEPRPTYLVRDRDALYGVAFQRQLETLGIEDTRIAPRQHWMNAYAERVVGILRLHAPTTSSC